MTDPVSDDITTVAAETQTASQKSETQTGATASTMTVAATTSAGEASATGTQAASQQSETQTDAATSANLAQVVYVGPRLTGKPFPVNPKTIFRGPLPKPLAKAMAADADLAALFVPVSDFGSALLALRRAGSAISRSALSVATTYGVRR